MRYLSIKNFANYQHYKDRRPPWIKLHAAVLDDYQFMCLQDASKAHLMLLWLLASKLDNRIPFDLAFISQRIGATSVVDIEDLVLHGFIEVSQDDSKPLASRKQNALVETEAETEKKLLSPFGEKKNGWPTEGSELWGSQVGPVAPGRFGKRLKPVVDKYGWPETKAALECYIELNEGKTRKLEWFADDAVRWVDLAKMPCVDPDTRELTEKGRLAYNSA